MELSSHQEGQIPISIPIPINTASYGVGGHGHHGHMIQYHHHHELALAAPHTHSTLIHNNHLITSSAAEPPPPPHNQIPTASINNNGSSIPTTTSPDQDEEEQEDDEEHVNVAYNHNNNSNNNNKKAVNSCSIKYKECLKNHAAAMGGTTTDGCGEFMPSGEEGTIEALTCSACNCHRNFHRKEIQGGMSSWDNVNTTRVGTVGVGRKVLLGHPNGHNKNMSILAPDHALGFHTATGGFLTSRTAPHYHPHHQMIMSYHNNMGVGGTHLPSESDEHDQQDQLHHHGHGHGHGCGRASVVNKKRFRTKFTQEQKEKMFNFAEKVGWKIQKQEESVVQSFCHEIGVKRRVLKVWMHNNKHNLAKNKSQPPPSTTTA